MTADEWRQKVAADRPPLSRAQIAVLRPICLHMTNAAPVAATTEAAPAMPAPQEPPRREPRNAQR
jgi:hypothetical protein